MAKAIKTLAIVSAFALVISSFGACSLPFGNNDPTTEVTTTEKQTEPTEPETTAETETETTTEALTMYISTRITRSLSTTSLSLMP